MRMDRCLGCEGKKCDMQLKKLPSLVFYTLCRPRVYAKEDESGKCGQCGKLCRNDVIASKYISYHLTYFYLQKAMNISTSATARVLRYGTEIYTRLAAEGQSPVGSVALSSAR